jgi:hypothetical protein
MKRRFLLILLVPSGVLLSPLSSLAGPGGTQGPGVCGMPPGQEISAAAQFFAGPTAGPNTGVQWLVAPSAPGQAIKKTCVRPA